MTAADEESIPLWMQECLAAAADIREHFGVENALQYIVGEKFVSHFLNPLDHSPEHERQVKAIAAAIRSLFTPEELYDFLKQAKRRPGTHERRDRLNDAMARLVAFRFAPARRKR